LKKEFWSDDHGHRAGLPLDPKFGSQTTNEEEMAGLRNGVILAAFAIIIFLAGAIFTG